jgi:hypothetical protein
MYGEPLRYPYGCGSAKESTTGAQSRIESGTMRANHLAKPHLKPSCTTSRIDKPHTVISYATPCISYATAHLVKQQAS